MAARSTTSTPPSTTCTRIRGTARLPRNNQRTAIQFIDYVLEKFPFGVECIQTDNGAEFQGAFHWHIRSHRIDNEEFYRLLDGVVTDDSTLFTDNLQEWEDYYNFHRPRGGFDGQTPYGRLRQETTNTTPAA